MEKLNLCFYARRFQQLSLLTLKKSCHYAVFQFRTFCKRNTEVQWESVVGLEVHAQIATKSKLFSRSSTSFVASPNSQVSFFDAALPGTLPVLNQSCVEAAVLTALALNCTVHKVSLFDRKHYFYSDLPVGYQITQQRMPLATNGKFEFPVLNPKISSAYYLCSSKIKQIQLEQDSGRSLHDEECKQTLVDLNRAGIGLMEIVFEPDLSNGEEAAALVRELQRVLVRLGTCTGKANEGAIRVDANVSVNKCGETMGVRTELKNINSVRFVAKAVDAEIKRQVRVLETGGSIINETRTYNDVKKQTFPIRDKETLQDYRYMPEPNLPPLRLCDNEDSKKFKHLPYVVNIDDIQKNIPILPAEERKKLIERYLLPLTSIVILVNEGLQDLFEHLMRNEDKNNSKFFAQILLTEILSQLKKRNMEIQEIFAEVTRIRELINILNDRKITFSKFRAVLDLMLEGDLKSPEEIIRENNWLQISEEEVENICHQVIEKSSKLVKEYRKGKDKALTLLSNEVIKMSDNRTTMKVAEKILLQIFKKS